MPMGRDAPFGQTGVGVDQFSKLWDQSYLKKQNNILEPYEELVKFLNRYVLDRDPDRGTPISKTTRLIDQTIVVDLGCGIGAQSEYLARLGFRCYGFDLSEVAIKGAIARTAGMENKPFFATCSSSSFSPPGDVDIALACASLDSMPFEEAVSYLVSLGKAVSRDALFFGTFIAEKSGHAVGEEVVRDTHEHGTIQSYFDVAKLENLLSHGSIRITRLDRIEVVNLIPGQSQRSPARFSVAGIFDRA